MKIEIKHRFNGAVLFSCEADSMKIAVKLAIEAKANLSDADLSGANLSRANLSEANLSRANLSGANLSGADLSGAYLSDADLSGAYLSDADLSRANLSGANLSEANLSRANLSGAYLSDADLSRANLSRANLSEANLSRADLSRVNMDYTNIPMWCGTLKGVKVDFRLVCQMLLHVFALECEDKRFKVVKKAIEKYARVSDKWEYYAEKHGLEDTPRPTGEGGRV